MNKYWLIKSEPDVYSIDDLAKNKITYWDGVRNYQARNYLRDEMKKGDKILFYHSNTDIVGVYGICEVIKEGYPDFTAFDSENKHYDPKSDSQNLTWFMVDVKFVKKLKNPVTLQAIKENPKLQKLKLIQRGNRLSVMPITQAEYNEIIKMSELK